MEKTYNDIIVKGDLQSTDNGKTFRRQTIGANYVNGARISGYLSSFDGSFTDEFIGVGYGIADIYKCVIGDVKEAYTILKEKMNNNKNLSFSDICSLIYETCDEFFGSIANINTRMDYYKPMDELNENDQLPQISNLKSKGAAMCVERAVLAQNLLKSLNIKSLYKCSGIINNGIGETHSYNLIEHENKYYIFDASIPTVIDKKVSPLVGEIDKKTFDLISSPIATIGCSVHVNHYNPLRDKQVDIIYDSGRIMSYEACEYIESKKDRKK